MTNLFLLFNFSQMSPMSWTIVLILNFLPSITLFFIIYFNNYFEKKKMSKKASKSSTKKTNFFK